MEIKEQVRYRPVQRLYCSQRKGNILNNAGGIEDNVVKVDMIIKMVGL